MNELKQLENIKKKLEKVKEQKANIQGKISSKKEQLLSLGFKDINTVIEDANSELIRLDKEISKATDNFDKMVEEFKESYPILFED